jgi:hypothetical protein
MTAPPRTKLAAIAAGTGFAAIELHRTLATDGPVRWEIRLFEAEERISYCGSTIKRVEREAIPLKPNYLPKLEWDKLRLTWTSYPYNGTVFHFYSQEEVDRFREPLLFALQGNRLLCFLPAYFPFVCFNRPSKRLTWRRNLICGFFAVALLIALLFLGYHFIYPSITDCISTNLSSSTALPTFHALIRATSIIEPFAQG